MITALRQTSVRIPAAAAALEGYLTVPEGAKGLVLFAHGSGSSRFSPRNRAVASRLQEAGLATLLLDLLTAQEEKQDDKTAELRFDIPLLAGRLEAAGVFARGRVETRELPVGYLGASTGAAAALIAASEQPWVRAVVCRGGRPDLAQAALPWVKAPTLFVVGASDSPEVIRWNLESLKLLSGPRKLELVPGASHLFEEPGALEKVAHLACAWFTLHLRNQEDEPVSLRRRHP